MDVLILGGTQFLGRAIVLELLAAGHGVSILTRGVSPDDLPAQVERLRGDRDEGVAGLRALAERSWDACVDVSGYLPGQVRPSAETLRDRVRRYVYISAVRAYGDPQERPVRETQPLETPLAETVTTIDNTTYGPLKATCEGIVGEVFGERATILRPQVVAGPGDPSGRYTHWVRRAEQAGEMLAPGDGTDHVQVIDVRDLACFARLAIEHDLAGPFNLAGPRLTWTAFITLLGAPRPVWVPADILTAANLSFSELPLYRPEGGAFSSLMDVSSERAQAHGLTLTDPATTIRDTRDWLRGREDEIALAPEREAALIEQARRQGG